MERQCAHLFPSGQGVAFSERIEPLTSMSLKGWLWYQGEFNVQTNAVSGSYVGKLGCERRQSRARPRTALPPPFGRR